MATVDLGSSRYGILWLIRSFRRRRPGCAIGVRRVRGPEDGLHGRTSAYPNMIMEFNHTRYKSDIAPTYSILQQYTRTRTGKSKCQQPCKCGATVPKPSVPPQITPSENRKRKRKGNTQYEKTQSFLITFRADLSHLITERYWGPNTTGGCAGGGHLTWPGESPSEPRAHTHNHPALQALDRAPKPPMNVYKPNNVE